MPGVHIPPREAIPAPVVSHVYQTQILREASGAWTKAFGTFATLENAREHARRLSWWCGEDRKWRVIDEDGDLVAEGCG